MLIDCVSTKRKITYEGGEFDVRAVSLTDVAGLISNHKEAVDRIATMMRVRKEITVEDTAIMMEIMIDVVSESPYLAADLISACADEPQAFEIALKLPMTVQVEALRTIGDLTFADGAALKKFVADVRNLLSGLLPPMQVPAAA